MIKIKEKAININLKYVAIILLGLPAIVFFFGWLKLYLAVLFTAVFVTGFAFSFKDKESNKKFSISINPYFLLLIFCIAAIWCWIGGIGGFFYQTLDHSYRNAILKDMIFNDWPVIYSITQRSLVYYIGIWLVPALFGKVAIAAGASAAVGWVVAKSVLLIYCSVLVCLVFLLIAKFLKLKSKKSFLIAIGVFVFFSGLDVVGFFGLGYSFSDFPIWHMEQWCGVFQISSNTTLLFWVYNQCIAPWIVTALILIDKKVSNLALYGLLAVPFGPLPFIGIFVLCVAIGIKQLIDSAKLKKVAVYFKQVFSVQNIASICSLGIVFLIYYMSNTIASGSSSGSSSDSSVTFLLSLNPFIEIIMWILLIVIEILPFAAFLFKSHKKDYIFYISMTALIFFPLIRVGTSFDFGARATIPALMILCLMFTEKLLSYLKEKKQKGSKRWVAKLMIFVLLVGAANPAVEFARNIYSTIEAQTLCIERTDIETLNTFNVGTNNFTSSNYKESVFYKYFSKQ